MQLLLKTPIQFGTETITALEFREDVRAKDLHGVRISELDLTDNLLKVAGRLCARPAPVMNELQFVDLVAVLEVVGGFLDRGPKSGSGGSP